MQNYIRQFRPFLIFLVRFFLAYIILTVAYQYYLREVNNPLLPDDITTMVTKQTITMIEWMGNESSSTIHPDEPSHRLLVNGKYVVRIIEGCNAVSVFILFAAFIIAFRGKLKHTVLYILGGVIIIHILNIIRIALLSIALLYYPQHEHLLHGILFPLFIYGVVFALWVVWVNKYSLYAGKNS